MSIGGEVRAGNVPWGVIITNPLGNDEVPESKLSQTENKPEGALTWQPESLGLGLSISIERKRQTREKSGMKTSGLETDIGIDF